MLSKLTFDLPVLLLLFLVFTIITSSSVVVTVAPLPVVFKVFNKKAFWWVLLFMSSEQLF